MMTRRPRSECRNWPCRRGNPKLQRVIRPHERCGKLHERSECMAARHQGHDASIMCAPRAALTLSVRVLLIALASGPQEFFPRQNLDRLRPLASAPEGLATDRLDRHQAQG